MSPKSLVCFTDGSALNNNKDAPAGWAFYIPKLKQLRYDSMIGTNNQAELEARYQVLIRDFIHSVKTEARIMTRMAQEGVYPALLRYQIELENVAVNGFSESAKTRAVFNANLMDELDAKTKELDQMIDKIIQSGDNENIIRDMMNKLRPAMQELAALLRKIELYCPYDVFPYPTEEELIVV